MTMDWRGTGAGGAMAGWDGCRSYPVAAGPGTAVAAGSQMPAQAMNGVVQQRRQMSYNAAAAAAAAAAGATGYGGASVKQEYARAVVPPPKYVSSATLTYLIESSPLSLWAAI